MMIYLNSILPYGRYLGGDPSPVWWYCSTEERVVSVAEARSLWGYPDLFSMLDSPFLTPLFVTDILREERAFLARRPKGPLVRHLMTLQDDMLDAAFRQYVEQAHLQIEWRIWEREALRRDAEEWCRQHGFLYR
jgi:hypothetical protein